MLSFPEHRRGRGRWIALAAAVILLLVFGRSLCSLIVDYLWWREMNQVSTWLRASAYLYATNIAEWLIAFLVLWIGHARGMKYAGAGLRENRLYSRLVTVALALVAMVIAAASMNGWVVARYAAGSGLASTWVDPVFGRPLGFYFFELPFYTGLVGFLEALAIAGALAYYLTARGWQIRREFPGIASSGRIDMENLKELGRLETGMLQALMAGFLIALAVNFWLDRYEMLYSDHGNLLVGIDYIQQNIGLPLQYAKAGAAILAALLVLARMRRWALACAIVLVFDVAIPPLVSSLYVKPNELLLEKPYLQRHIEATRSAFGLAQKVRETQFDAHKEGRIDFTRNQAMLDNVRLWDWRAFHDTLSQSQPLRPYAYADTDVDRYMIDGKLRQTLLAPRELDLNQLGEAQNSWINTSTTYTHGYGLVLAEASRISPTGLPELLIRNAPVQVETPSLKLTRPEIYFGESAHEPVFAPTKQLEFNYPATPDVKIHYDGQGGFSIASLALRTVAAIAEGDWNIFLSDAITADSRMMIHRKVLDRLGTLAEFVRWDPDPYMVITESGRLEWIVDGYMTSDAHPYSREVQPQDEEPFNYIRNSVKATVDAYDGTVTPVRLRLRRPSDSGLPAPVPGSFPARLGHAGRSSRAHPLAGGIVPRSGRGVPHLPHARSRVVLQSRGVVGPGHLRANPGSRRWHAERYAGLHGDDPARGSGSGVCPDHLLYAARETEPDRPDGGALRRRSSGRNRIPGAPQAGNHFGAFADRRAGESGSGDLQGPDVVGPARLTGAASSDSGAAHRPYVPVRRADLHPGGAGAHAAVAEGGAGHGQHAGLRGHLREGSGELGGDSGRASPARCRSTVGHGNECCAANQCSRSGAAGRELRRRRFRRGPPERDPRALRALQAALRARQISRGRQGTGSHRGRREEVAGLFSRPRHGQIC